MWGHQGDGTWLRLNRLVWWLHHVGLPAPSCELTHGTCAKARVLCVLDRRVQREAGFTEQRTLPTPDSGGITGHCFLSPQHLSSLASGPLLFWFYGGLIWMFESIFSPSGY
ncbi:hypothetical protein KIW84_071621 [Lathyrus oleraceus]|uniref:Secreted protein n=1 Tax=Pisum sativum TaxID=3888 RepID=A0A9D4VKP3_PEA|nr:hypothetical protein KIW84_071621 [Pisum sativum]